MLNVNFLRLVSISSLLIIVPGCQVFFSSTEDNSAIPTLPSTSPPQAQMNFSVATEPPLPPLTTKERETIDKQGRELAQGWLDLAGLNKLIRPPFFSQSLRSFRGTWGKVNADITPFLGLWHDDGSAGQIYWLSIFPNQTPGKVCLLEFRPQLQVAQEILLEPIFKVSTAKVENGQLLGNRLRSAQSLIFTQQFFTGDSVELISILDVQNEVRVFAAKSVPTFPDEFSAQLTEEVSEAFAAQGCKTSLKIEQ